MEIARSVSRALGAPARCSRPTYGRVLGGDAVGHLVTAAFLGAGIGIGAAAGGKAGAAAGAGLGVLAGIYPTLLAQRAVIRSKACTNPGLGRLFLYQITKGAVSVALFAAARALEPSLGPVGSAVTFFSAPVVGKAIIQS